MVGPVRGHTQANTALSAFAGSPARRVPRGPASPRRAARLDGEHAGLPEPRGRPGHSTQRRPAGAGRGPAQRGSGLACHCYEAAEESLLALATLADPNRPLCQAL